MRTACQPYLIANNFYCIQSTSIECMKLSPALKLKLFCDYKKAALDDDPEVEVLLAICYEAGFGVEIDRTSMIEWYVKAAEHESLDAICSMASKCEVKDIPRDAALVFGWFQRAAEAGHRDAQSKVAMCYREGTGVERDFDKYLHWQYYTPGGKSKPTWLHLAARNGDVEAVRYLAQLENAEVNKTDGYG